MTDVSKSQMDALKKKVLKCKKCGEEYLGGSAIGIGKTKSPKIFFIGMNPWTENGEFKNGRGITLLFKKLKEWKFDSFFFDNVVKCEMPNKKSPKTFHANNCKNFLLEQLQILKDPKIVVFGLFAAEHLNLRYIPWADSSSIITVPHFSSIFYPHGMSENEYYKRLRKIINTSPKQKELF